MTDFWETWDSPGKKRTPRPAPKCKTHGTPKVRQTAKSPYRCPDCEREAYWAERGGDASRVSPPGSPTRRSSSAAETGATRLRRARGPIIDRGE